MKEKKSFENIVIVASGEDYEKNKILNYCENSDYIISVDGGLNILDKLRIKPSIIIGDMDSVDKKLLTKYKKIQAELFPTDKDFTDSELAIKKALSLKPKLISILACIGNYFDHSFANVINLLKYHADNINLEIITSNSKIFPLTKEKKIVNSMGRRFSLFPLSDVKGLKISGARYDYNDKNKLSCFDYSISNVIIDNDFHIKLKKGLMFCVIFDEGYK